jgi:uncharacterized Zn finger protein (UPF0148 family)
VRMLQSQAERAIASVIEAECPLCKVELRVHDGSACCPCCGDSYNAAKDRLEIRPCPEHSRRCEHWEAIWTVMPPGDSP